MSKAKEGNDEKKCFSSNPRMLDQAKQEIAKLNCEMGVKKNPLHSHKISF